MMDALVPDRVSGNLLCTLSRLSMYMMGFTKKNKEQDKEKKKQNKRFDLFLSSIDYRAKSQSEALFQKPL